MTGEHRFRTPNPAGPGGWVDGDDWIDGDVVRCWRAVGQHHVTAAALAAYAAATNDPHQDRLAGGVAPPTYACVPFFSSLLPFLRRLLGAEDIGRVIHLGYDLECRNPIGPGEELITDSEPAALRDGPGATLKIRGTTRHAGGALANTQTATLLIRGARCVNPIGAREAPLIGTPQSRRISTPQARRSSATRDQDLAGTQQTMEITVDADQPARYADASGDRNPIHLDASAARRAGFGSVILHGMCTLALTCHALESRRQALAMGSRASHRLARTVRTPRLPSRPSHRGMAPAGRDRRRGVGFRCPGRHRRIVLRDGWIGFSAVPCQSILLDPRL